MKNKKSCSGTVWRGPAYVTGCHKGATVTREGERYCGTHDPERVAKKKAAWDRWFKAQSTAKDKWYAATEKIRKLVERHPDFAKLRRDRNAATRELAEANKLKKSRN